MMSNKPLRWALSEGAFLFQVPDLEGFIPTDTIILLSSTLYAIEIFFEKGEIKFFNDNLSIIRINFHPPLIAEGTIENESTQGYVIHSAYKDGLCFQSIFLADEINNQLSEFEKAFLDSIVNNLLNTLTQHKRKVSDIPFLKDRVIIKDIEMMLNEIDTKYQSLVASWTLSLDPNVNQNRFEFGDVLYNGKIRVEEMFYDLGERAIESYNQLMMSKEEKIILYKIAKSLINLSGLLYEDYLQSADIQLKFFHSEIILESNVTKKLFRLYVRSYEIDGEPYCDITILS